jgi:dUTP pyrophosphatase
MDKLKVKIINNSRHRLPEYATPSAAGMDLKANTSEPILLGPLERQLIPTGIHIQLPVGYEAQVRPRSGLALKHGITVCNTPGTVN